MVGYWCLIIPLQKIVVSITTVFVIIIIIIIIIIMIIIIYISKNRSFVFSCLLSFLLGRMLDTYCALSSSFLRFLCHDCLNSDAGQHHWGQTLVGQSLKSSRKKCYQQESWKVPYSLQPIPKSTYVYQLHSFWIIIPTIFENNETPKQ